MAQSRRSEAPPPPINLVFERGSIPPTNYPEAKRLFYDFKWDGTRFHGQRRIEKDNVKWEEVENDAKGKGKRDT